MLELQQRVLQLREQWGTLVTITSISTNGIASMLSSAMKEISPKKDRKLKRVWIPSLFCSEISKTFSLESKPRYSPLSLRNLPQRNPSLDKIIDYGRATMVNSATAPTGAATGHTVTLSKLDTARH
jgi:hypothetical protein